MDCRRFNTVFKKWMKMRKTSPKTTLKKGRSFRSDSKKLNQILECGIKPTTVVEEHCVLGGRLTERIAGLHTRENAGISSER